jgi:hypothetical protein
VSGSASDAFCLYYTIAWAAPEGYGGAIACASQGAVQYYKRLTGTVYIADPYAKKISNRSRLSRFFLLLFFQ